MTGSGLLSGLKGPAVGEVISDFMCKRTLARQYLFRTWNRGVFDDVITGRVTTYMTAHQVPNLSIALAKGDRLVFEQGYPPPFGSDVRFRVASVSKTLTATAVMTLVEAGSLDLDRTVFGAGALLGTTYGTKPYSARVRAVTVRHLLHHIAGGWPFGNEKDPMFDPAMAGLAHGPLIGRVLDTVPLGADPGTVSAYSNFGYCLLGRVIEAVGGLPYEQYVRENVLRPCGITRMEIGGGTLAARKPDEAEYHRHPDLPATPENDPYALDLDRMDAHGGWIASPIDLLRFMIRVDLQDAVPDLLSRRSLDAMFTGSGPWPGYGLGWGLSFVQVPLTLGGGSPSAGPDILTSVSHDGAMAGTLGFLTSRTLGDAACAILVNTRPPTDFHAAGLAGLADGILGKIGKWPDYDLFACPYL